MEQKEAPFWIDRLALVSTSGGCTQSSSQRQKWDIFFTCPHFHHLWILSNQTWLPTLATYVIGGVSATWSAASINESHVMALSWVSQRFVCMWTWLCLHVFPFGVEVILIDWVNWRFCLMGWKCGCGPCWLVGYYLPKIYRMTAINTIILRTKMDGLTWQLRMCVTEIVWNLPTQNNGR